MSIEPKRLSEEQRRLLKIRPLSVPLGMILARSNQALDTRDTEPNYVTLGCLLHHIRALEAELQALKDWKEDVEDDHAAVMAEPCPGDDRKHCTCVPSLRAVAKKLEAEIVTLKKEVVDLRIYNSKLRPKAEAVDQLDELLRLKNHALWFDLDGTFHCSPVFGLTVDDDGDSVCPIIQGNNIPAAVQAAKEQMEQDKHSPSYDDKRRNERVRDRKA